MKVFLFLHFLLFIFWTIQNPSKSDFYWRGLVGKSYIHSRVFLEFVEQQYDYWYILFVFYFVLSFFFSKKFISSVICDLNSRFPLNHWKRVSFWVICLWDKISFSDLWLCSLVFVFQNLLGENNWGYNEMYIDNRIPF